MSVPQPRCMRVPAADEPRVDEQSHLLQAEDPLLLQFLLGLQRALGQVLGLLLLPSLPDKACL
eukprot:8665375-Alexandrium_andersonii.AAC.1